MLGVATPKLLPGESTVYDARPHLLYFALPFAWGLPLLAVTVAFTRVSGFLADVLRILLSLFSLVWLLWSLWHFVQWWFTRFTVSNYRVVGRRGVLARSGVEIPLDRVSNVNFNQSIVERIFGAGDLVIESSGQDGQSRFSDIRHPDDVQLLIHRQIQSRTPHATSAQPSILEALRELGALHASGALSPEEFAAAKKKLLG